MWRQGFENPPDYDDHQVLSASIGQCSASAGVREHYDDNSEVGNMYKLLHEFPLININFLKAIFSCIVTFLKNETFQQIRTSC